jgi:putative transposase
LRFIPSGKNHVSKGAFVFIVAVSLYRDSFLKPRLSGSLLGLLHISLTLLRSINPAEADTFSMVAVQYFEGVAAEAVATTANIRMGMAMMCAQGLHVVPNVEFQRRSGAESAGTAMDAWAAQHGAHLHFIQPGEPTQNAYIESFNGKFRDESLNEHWLLTSLEAQVVIEVWRKEYYEERTHSTIGNLTPMEFINHHQNRPQAAQEFTSLAVVS